MAQQPHQSDKRATRKARKAEEAARAQARAQQAAKERKQQTIIGVIVIAILVVLIAIAGVAVYRSTHPQPSAERSTMSAEDAHERMKTLDSRPKHADDEGGILVSAKGYGKAVEGVPTIGVYMDFLCPGCGSLNRTLDKDLVTMVDAGQINLDMHFMSFMDRLSTDEYSTRAANAVLYVTDHDEDTSHLFKALEHLYSEDFQPEEGSAYQSVSDERIRQQLVDAGVPEDVADSALTRDYDDWLDAGAAYTPTREELHNVSGTLKGQMSTPTVTINGRFWDMNDPAVTGKPSITEALLDAIGLKTDQMGVKGDLPSIGADGAPLIP